MITMSWDIANNIANFIQVMIGILTVLLGGLITMVVKYANMKNRLTRAEELNAKTQQELDAFKFEVTAENLRLEGKLDSFQLTLSTVANGISKIQGFMEAKFNAAP